MQNRIRLAVFFVWCAIPCLCDVASLGQAVQRAGTRELLPEVSLEREIAGGDEHHYAIRLTSGQSVTLRLVKQGIALTSTIKNPTQQELFTAKFETRENGTDTILLIAQTAGTHTLVIKPKYGKMRAGRYQIKIEELHDASEPDRQRFVAQQAFIEADLLFHQETDQSHRAALQKLAVSLQLWQSLRERTWEARTLLQIGWNHYELNDCEAALDHFTRALEIRRAESDTAGESEALAAASTVYNFLGEHQKSFDYLTRTLALQQPLNERWQTAGTYFELAKAYWLGLYDNEKALENFQQALRLYREIGDPTNEAETLTDLAMLQIMQGNYQAALDNSQSALAINRAEKMQDGEGSTLHHIGAVYYNLGNQQKALDYYHQALTIFQTIGADYAKGHVLTSIAMSYNVLGDQQKALKSLNEAVTLHRQVKDPSGEAGARRYLGKIYRELGDFPKALEHLNQALEIAKAMNDLNNEGAILTLMGEVLAEMGNYQEAIKRLKLALSVDHATSFPRSEARALLALAQVERTRGNLADAQVHVEAALGIIESLRAKVGGAEHRSSYLVAQQGSYELYIDLLMPLHERTPTAGHAAHALQISERARARALLESLAEAQADIRQGVAPSLLERERALQAQLNAKEQQRLKLLSGKPTPEQTAAADRAVEAALTEYQQVQAQIRATSPRYAALTQPQPLEIRQMQAQLDEATLLLVYSLGVKRSFLWAVTPTTVKSYELPAREKLEKDARRVIDLLLHSHERKSSALAGVVAEEFSRQILGPVAGQLAQQRLVIVADGALHSIPFAALFTPGRKQRLIAEHEIVNLPSVSALSQLRQDSLGRGSAPKTIAVIADPVFKLEDVRFGTTVKRATAATQEFTGSLATLQRAARDIGLKDLYRLQASGREADQIIRLVPPSLRTLLVGFDASRATLAQTDLSQYQMLHFATHSFIHPQSSELSGIVLSLYDRKRHAQDGFLRAHEIYNLKLNADLVVLSACRTAGDKVVRGEGLIGLSRGFMYAGAPRLIVSLWEVNDVATAELMQRFYRGMLRDKLRPAAALRAAQSAMAQEPRWSAPYYWAGFVLQGEWR